MCSGSGVPVTGLFLHSGSQVTVGKIFALPLSQQNFCAFN